MEVASLKECLVILALLAAGACAPPEAKPAAPRPEVVLHDVTLRSYRGNTVTATGYAERLAYERSSSNIELERPKLRLPARAPGAGKMSALGAVQIHASRADGNVGQKRMEAYAGVELRAESGMVANTDRALFDGQTLLTSGAGPVKVRAPNYALDAVGCFLNSRDEDFDFGGPLRSGLGTFSK